MKGLSGGHAERSDTATWRAAGERGRRVIYIEETCMCVAACGIFEGRHRGNEDEFEDRDECESEGGSVRYCRPR